MVEHKQLSNANEYYKDDKMDACSCLNYPAIFVCNQTTKCTGPGDQAQEFFCGSCGEVYHDHRFISVQSSNKNVAAEWIALFEKIEKTFTQATDKFKELRELIDFCEAANNKLRNDLKYKGNLYAEDYQSLCKLYEEIISQKKAAIEGLISEFKLKDLADLNQMKKTYKAQIDGLEYLTDINDHDIQVRYSNIFTLDLSNQYDNLSVSTFKMLLKFKHFTFQSISKEKSQDPQDTSKQNENLMLLMQINNETIKIADMKHTLEIQESLAQSENQTKESLHTLQLTQSSIQQTIEKLQNTIQLQAEKIKNLEQTLKNQIMINNIKENKIENIYVLKECQKTTSSKWAQSIVQLSNGNIITNQLNNIVHLHDPMTLTSVQTLQSQMSYVECTLEFQNYLFITNYDKQLLLINSQDYSLIDTAKVDGNGSTIQLIDSNHIIVGGYYQGWLWIFSFKDNKLTEKKKIQPYGSKYIQQILKLEVERQYAVSVRDVGVKIAVVDINNNYDIQQLPETYLAGHCVTSILQVDKHTLICGSWSHNSYWIINLESRKEEKLCDGFDKVQAMTLFPSFHNDTYSLVLTKELENICIINFKKKSILKIFKCDGLHESTWSNQACSILFLKGMQKLNFVTHTNKVDLARYKIKKKFIDYLLQD